jgi:hypothetical protein
MDCNLLFHLFKRRFFSFPFLPQQVVSAHAIMETRVMLSGGQIWSFIVSLNAQSCPLPHDVARVNK